MIDNLDCFALTCWVESRAGFTCCATSLEESSNSAQPLAPEGGGVWRCLAVEKLCQVELHSSVWHSEPRSPRQTCIDKVDFDTDVQPGDDPQKGQ